MEHSDIASTGGFDDGAIAEVVAHVALNFFTTYFNHVAGTGLVFS